MGLLYILKNKEKYPRDYTDCMICKVKNRHTLHVQTIEINDNICEPPKKINNDF